MPTTTDDKYSRGVVGVRTGSDAYPGAAVLGVEGAWRTGVGMVRYVGGEKASALVLARRPETVAGAGRVNAWVIGSGTDPAHRTPDEEQALRKLLSGEVPVVVDAGALDLAPGASAPLVVTPHGREHDRLREAAGLAPLGDETDTDARSEAALETAAALGATVLVKGATTIAATPSGWGRRITSGTPWLASAGTGDVLGGVLGALIATGSLATVDDLGPLAATAAWLHGSAATQAAAVHGPIGGPITALDVAHALPGIIGRHVTPG
ncbi:ADP-dependent NAD(P)H-hydrate dehydratase [Microbacterium sp. RD1]|uniref:ADP-dependent NAD(P)H-hydrate dehydratase n=1 Tax=Microbacterium sp. RD1 TaxID=3457313 RepID=UPI003FA5C9C6